jgi:hypothetical protein
MDVESKGRVRALNGRHGSRERVAYAGESEESFGAPFE